MRNYLADEERFILPRPRDEPEHDDAEDSCKDEIVEFDGAEP